MIGEGPLSIEPTIKSVMRVGAVFILSAVILRRTSVAAGARHQIAFQNTPPVVSPTPILDQYALVLKPERSVIADCNSVPVVGAVIFTVEFEAASAGLVPLALSRIQSCSAGHHYVIVAPSVTVPVPVKI